MSNVTIEQKHKVAIQLVIMDAIEKGHTNKQELIAYMSSEVFEKAVNSYVSLIGQQD